MQCLPTTAWSSLPDCTCPVPKITQSLVTLKENCNFKKRYEHCAVACPQGYAVQTDGAFACLPTLLGVLCHFALKHIVLCLR
ncbi:hypothetical protein TNCT_246471 [Trichonephila clavata]|uniref:Uncharacterized protein n=1 Tax=Trichonephila clavata TaxID=2740835 RepID=A0A8X6I416_TRICU|nr:hypothetical protein TNCT_246471 [Trichonephila clavata]